MKNREKRRAPIRSPRLGLAYLRSLSKPELFLWLVFLGITAVSILWAYG